MTTLPEFAAEMNGPATLRRLGEALSRADDGELFLERTRRESYFFDDGQLKQASRDESQGFGLRAVRGETVAYAHSSQLDDAAFARAAAAVRGVDAGQPSVTAAIAPPFGRNRQLYMAQDPLAAVGFAAKRDLLATINDYVRRRDARVAQVSITLAGSYQEVAILRADGRLAHDHRPLVRLSVQVVMRDGERRESGSSGAGGRYHYGDLLTPAGWRPLANEALRMAEINLQSRPAPAGEMPVVLGGGWCGVLLHEAVGHGLEGDFNRKGSSTFSGRIGTQVAARGVTIVDDGTLADRRGTLTIDDEGTPTARNLLIEDGVLRGYLQDRLNARLMGVAATGSGRRESYQHAPLPRMNNTFMLAGSEDPAALIARAGNGVYAAHLGGGQVDITSGKFVFQVTEAYRIEHGKITAPLKGVTLIGSGPEIMGRIAAIGHDMALDPGVGTCGKAGQSVPVGVGQPSLLISAMTVGGTDTR